jgi:putative Mg2+ transporter-C (MgtC) family protein
MTEEFSWFVSMLPMILLRTGAAIVCGGIIGIERERRGKAAGFRTNTLICLGSAIYVLASDLLFVRMGITNTDPTRIAAQIVTGIGFLGAGTIIQSRGTVTGLTTAATIWVVAGIGVLIGSGFPLLGFLCTLMVLMTLVVLVKLEPRLLGRCRFVTTDVLFNYGGGEVRGAIATILADYDMDESKYEIKKLDEATLRLRITYCDKHPSHHRFLPELWRVPGVVEMIKNGADRGPLSGPA